VVKTFIIGLVALSLQALYFVTRPGTLSFTMAAKERVSVLTKDAAVNIPEWIRSGGALDFASSLFAWVIYHSDMLRLNIVGPDICWLSLALFHDVHQPQADC
jgi:PTS system galactitol-specific IIC component